MGNEGQNSPSQTSGAERKRPWEIFPEAEISAIEKRKKQLDQHEKKRLRMQRYKSKIARLMRVFNEHKILTVAFLAMTVVLSVIAGIVIFAFLLSPLRQNEEEIVEDSYQDTTENPYSNIDVNLKTTTRPTIARQVMMMKFKPILTEGVFDSDTINFSKLEDNYNAFSQTLESDYEKICYYLAMIDVMFLFESDFGSARAAFLFERFDEKKLKLDNTQTYFYLISRLDYAIYKKDQKLVDQCRFELDSKYPVNDNYIEYDTGELITDSKILEEIKKTFKDNEKKYDNEN